MGSDTDNTYDWDDTYADGSEWEKKIYERIVKVFTNAKRLEGKNPSGDIDTCVGFRLEVKGETGSALSGNILIEWGRVYHDNPNNFYEVRRVQSGLTNTTSRYYIHCDEANGIYVTRVDDLCEFIEKYAHDREYCELQYDVKMKQRNSYTFFDNVLIRERHYKAMSKYCHYDDFNEEFIKANIV